MRLEKKSNYVGFNIAQPESWVKDVDSDLRNIFTFFKGRVRFGDGTDEIGGENISGEFQVVTTGTADTEFTVNHGIGAVPVGFLVIKINKGGVVYDSGTAWSSTQIFLKCSTATTVVTLFLLK